MRSDPLEVALRVRSRLEERAAVAHASAVAVSAQMAAAAAAATSRREVEQHRGLDVGSVASLQRAHLHRKRLAGAAQECQRALEEALRAEEAAREALVQARSDRRAVSKLRDREEERVRRTRDAALDDELDDTVAHMFRRRAIERPGSGDAVVPSWGARPTEIQ